MQARKLKVRVRAGDKNADHSTHELDPATGKAPVKIKAIKGAKYILEDAEGTRHVAPHEVKVWRVGKDLHIRTSDNPNEVIIEDYYSENANENALLGQAEDGSYYPFVSEDPSAVGEIPNLPDGGAPVDVALGEPATSAVGAVAGSGISPWWIAAGLLGAGVALGGGHGGGGGEPLRPIPPVPPVGKTITDFSGLEYTGDVQGYIHAGDHTTDKKPTFNGAGLTKDDTVNIYDTVDGVKTLLGSTVVGADGAWSFTPPTDISVGVHSVTFTDTPAAGTEGKPSAALIFIVDVDVTPTPHNFSLALAQGETPTSPILEGKGDEGDTVTISDTVDGVTTIIGTATVVDGKWSFTPPAALALGAHTITATESYQDTPVDVQTLKFTVTSSGVSASSIAASVEDFSLTSSTQPLTILSNMATITGALATISTTGSGANFTNATTINYGGKAVANAAVQVTINGKTYNTTADALGNYNIVIPSTDRLASNVSWVPQIRVTDPVSHAVSTVAGTPFITDYNPPVGSTVAMTAATTSSTYSWAHSYGTTNNKTPVFSGTAEAGSQVSLTVAGKTYTTIASSTGSYSIAIPAAAALQEGKYTPVIKVTDKAGNSATVNGLEITIDTTAPTGETISLDSSSYTGTSTSMTQSVHPVLSGNAEAGSLVTVAIHGKTYSTVASAAGTYKITVAETLTDGSYVPTVTVTDKAGNQSTVTGTPITIATHGPSGTERLDAASDTGFSNTDGITRNNTPVLTGITGAGVKVSIELNGHTYTTTADANGFYSVKVTDPLPGGNSITYVPKVTFTDGANNSTTIDGQSIILKTGADNWGQPNGLTTNVPKDTNSDGVLTASEAFQGGNFLKVEAHFDKATCRVGDVVTVTDGVNKYSVALTATSLAAGFVSFDVPIPPAGVKTTYLATLTDIAGNVAQPDLAHSASVTYVDKPNGNVAPTVTVTTDANHDGYLNAAEVNGQTSLQVRISFDPASAGVNQQVYLNGVNVAVLTAADVARGYVTTTIPTPASGTTINLSAKIYDASSNLWSPAGTATEIVDTVVPAGETGALDTLSWTGFDHNMTSQKSPYYSGSAEANAKVAVTINGKIYNTTADSTGHYVVKVTDTLADAKYTPTVLVTDVAGNSSSVTGTAFTVVTKPPAVTEALTDATDTGINDGITYNLTPTMEGTTIAGGHVTIKVNGHTYNTTADATGHYAVAIPAADAFSKTPASYVPLITVVDGAGNTVVDKVGQTIQIINTSDTNNKPVVTQVMDDRNSDGVLTPSELAGHNYVTVRAKFPPGIHVGDNIILSNGVDPLAGYNVSTAALAAGYYDFYLPLPAAGVKYTYYATLTDYEGVVVRPAATDCATIVYLNGNPNGGVAPTVTINQDTNHDGYVNAAELGGNSTFTVTATFDRTKVGVGQSVDFTSLSLPAQHVILTAADIANGYVTATYNVPANGTHFSVNAKITDNANGKSSPDGTAADIFDFVAPTGETGALDPISQTGTAANVTASHTPTYSGLAEANAHVDVTINGHVYGTTADGTGHYSVTVLPAFALQNGTTYTPSITVIDKAGNSSSVTGTAFTVDTMPPAALLASFQDTGANSTDGVTHNGVITLSGFEAGATWQYKVDGGAWVTGTGTTLNLVDDGQQHVYVMRQTDTGGSNSTVTAPIVATYDHTDPFVTSISIDNVNLDVNGTTNVYITFDGKVENFDASDITATNGYVDGLVYQGNNTYIGTFHATGTGSSSIHIDPTISGYEDGAGNQGTASASTDQIVVSEDISSNTLVALINAATSTVSGSTVVDLSQGNVFTHQTLSLTVQDVLSVATPTTPLVVDGDATDSVLIANGTGSAVTSTTTTFNGHQYSAYDLNSDGNVDLLIEQTMHKAQFSV